MAKDPPLTMEEALKQFERKPHHGEAVEFLRTHMHMLKTEGQFMKAYAGLSACQQLLGPLSPEYRKALEEMRKTLDSMVKARNQMTPDAWISLVQGTWEDCCKLFQTYLPAEAWNAIGDKTKDLFKNLRG